VPRKRLARNIPRSGGEDEPLAQDGAGVPRARRSCHIAAGVIACIMLYILCALSTTHVLWCDDQYSDMSTLMGGENFATHGLIRLRFLPVLYVGAMTDPPSYYTHYPPLPYVVNGLIQIVGIRSLAVMRVLCGLLCIAGLIGMYLAFAPHVGPFPAVCGLGFIATTGYFFTYGIGLHQHVYNIFFLGVFLLFFLRGAHADRAPAWWWAVCWAALLLESLTSFEFILWPQAFAWVYVLCAGRIRHCWRQLLLLATAPVVGVGLHFLQNVWAMGWSWAVADAVDAFRRPGRGPAQDRWAILRRVPEFVLSHSARLYYWPWTVLPVLGAVWFVLTGRENDESPSLRKAGPLLLGAVAGSVTWYLFMPIHTVKHPHTMSQLLPLVMLVMGGTTAVALEWLLKRGANRHQRALSALALGVLIYGQTQSVAECFERAETQRPLTFYLFEALGPDAFDPKVGVLTNTYADCQLAYFIRRPVWRSPDVLYPFPESVTTLQSRLPPDWRIGYYVFDTRGDMEAYPFLARTCVGHKVTIPGSKSPHYLIVFDITPLHLPEDQRPKLDPAIQQKQANGDYPDWNLPGFYQRLTTVLTKHGKLG